MTTEKQNESVPVEQVSSPGAEDVLTPPPAAEPAVTEPQALATAAEPVTTGEEPAAAETESAPAEEENLVAEDAAGDAEVPAAAEKTDESGEAPVPVQVAKRKVKTPAAEQLEEQKTETAPEALPAEEAPVDFSDEEADLAANAPEFDLGEEEQSETEHKENTAVQTDYNGMSKGGLVDAFAVLLSEKPVHTIRRDAEAIKIAFYKLHRADVEQLRKAFVESGGKIEDFVSPVDETEQRLKDLFVEYRRKRNEFLAGIEEEKEKNYKIKLGIIEELKELINSNETLNHTFTAFRELQQRWKDTGLVPQTHLKDLWETYNLHVENFYNVIKINKELRDLDLKKNYETKLQLCEEAEALVLEPSVITAFHKLQKLHEIWRETGPVANDYKEQLWERFREASSKINKRHQEYFETLKEEQKRNLDLKAELCAKTEELAEMPFTTRKEWNKASEQLIEIQKVWKTIGFAPKKDNARVYERFRTACDRFFENKRNFYLQVKNEMDANLQLKNEICEQAEALQESEEWKKATDELIALQKRWKEIGPVSRRYSDAVWKRFRKACDRFFERKSGFFARVDSEYEENLARKNALLEELRNFVVEEREKGFEAIKELQRRWAEIGFVPIKQKDAIQAEYRKLVDAVFAQLRGSDRERNMERFRGKISGMKEGNADRRVRHERDRLYNKLKQVEADIALLENNIGFFAKSKNAEAMIRDVNAKIEKLKEEMAVIIEKINVIDKQGE